MKILILSANTGEGHNSSARALMRNMEERGIEVQMTDVLSIASKRVSNNISKAYVGSTQVNIFPRLYLIGKWISDHMNHIRTSPVYLLNKLYWGRLNRYIKDGKYDAVVALHLFAAESLTAIKRKGELHIPAFFVMTDYTIHPFIAETDLEYYIIPHKDLIPTYLKRGMKAESIYPIGIPVNEYKFMHKLDKLTARHDVIDKMNWNVEDDDSSIKIEQEAITDGKWYLVMSGSMGFGDMTSLLKIFAQRINQNDRIICVCGNNQKTYNDILTTFADDHRILPVGYTKQVHLLMDASDVILTKPGGVTTTETFIKNMPIIHTAPISAIEKENAQFCQEHGMSVYSTNQQEQVELAIQLANDEQERQQMMRHQRENTNPHTATTIVNFILKVINKQKNKKK